jgi:predicted RNA-binding Zn ribbon-like protein
MTLRPGELWLPTATLLRVGSGELADVDRLAVADGAVTDVLAFSVTTGEPHLRRIKAVRRTSRGAAWQVVLATGSQVTTDPRCGLLSFDAGLTVRPAADTRPGEMCVVPRLDLRTTGAEAELRRAASRAFGRRPNPMEITAGAMTGPMVRLPMRLDSEVGWLLGALLAPTRRAAVARHVRAAYRSVFRTPRAGAWDGVDDHPVVDRFVADLRATCGWLVQSSRAELGSILSGLVDAAGSVRASHRQLTARVAPPTASALRRALFNHGIVTSLISRRGGSIAVVAVAPDDAAAAARLLRPRSPGLSDACGQLRHQGPGRSSSLGPQQELVHALLDEIATSRRTGRVAAADMLADALGVGERAVYELLAGRRSLHWDELGGLARIDAACQGMALDRLRAIPLPDLAPLAVVAAGPAPGCEGYAIELEEGPPAAMLAADDVAVTGLPRVG